MDAFIERLCKCLSFEFRQFLARFRLLLHESTLVFVSEYMNSFSLRCAESAGIPIENMASRMCFEAFERIKSMNFVLLSVFGIAGAVRLKIS